MVKLKEGVRAVMERTHLARTTGRVVRESSAFEPMEQTPNTCAPPAGGAAPSRTSLPCPFSRR